MLITLIEKSVLLITTSPYNTIVKIKISIKFFEKTSENIHKCLQNCELCKLKQNT